MMCARESTHYIQVQRVYIAPTIFMVKSVGIVLLVQILYMYVRERSDDGYV